jgi:archaellum component FlaF (FlaF/FlaG flagellin family)
MRAPRSVGIGPNVEVNTPDSIVLGNDNGTVVKQVQGSTADLFSVNLYNTSVGDSVDKAFTVEDDGSVIIGQDEIDIQTPGNGVVVTTPDGTSQYRIAVDNNGNVTSEEI